MADTKDLIAAVGAHLEYVGHCEDSEEDGPLCEYPECTYCALALAYDAFVNNRAPDHVLRRGDNVEVKLGPVYSLLEGHSVSERGTLTNGEGGILQARNVWTLADLQRAEALAVGEQCKLDGDEVWIRREE